MSFALTVVFIVKLILGGLAAFFAVMLWSRTKDSAWMCVVMGAVIKYGATVYDMLIELGIFDAKQILIFGVPFSSLVLTAIPDIFFIIAFCLMLYRNR